MLVRRRLALTMIATAALAVAGCASNSHALPSRTEMSPKDALMAAVADLGQISYAVEVTESADDRREAGTVDPRKRTGTINTSGLADGMPASIDAVLVSPDIWIKVDLGAAANQQYGIPPKSWMKVDASKISKGKALPFDLANLGDALDLGGLLAGVTAHRSDTHTLTGTIDLTRATGVSAPDPAAVARAGDRARAVPFQATVDDQGRLTRITVDGGSADPNLAVRISFSDYGTSADVSRPNDNEIAPTPDSVYQLLTR